MTSDEDGSLFLWSVRNPNKPEQNSKLIELRKYYRSLYRTRVLSALSGGRKKIYGPYGEERGWYDPDEDREVQKIDAMYDLFECLVKARKVNDKDKPIKKIKSNGDAV